ncbi:MAG: aspartate carbamoyltransferase catalytic subunit [Actinomycetes bacterium]
MKHLLSVKDLSKAQSIEILNLSVEMQNVNSRDIKKLPALNGRTVANLFFEDSTRTRISFELAAKRLSADVINFTAKGSSISKGESLKDTVQTLEAMGVEALIVRHNHSGAVNTIANAEWSNAAVINAGDGTHEHPTQALLDALTIRQRIFGKDYLSDLSGLRVLIVGDILHSRVARSNLYLLRTLGAEVSVCAPATLIPEGIESLCNFVYFNLDEALLQGFDAVMMLRIQAERMSSAFMPNAAEYASGWGLGDSRFLKLGAKTLILHPGPMNRGLEISSAAADSVQSAILDQVTNGVAVRMAVLYKLLAQEQNNGK